MKCIYLSENYVARRCTQYHHYSPLACVLSHYFCNLLQIIRNEGSFANKMGAVVICVQYTARLQLVTVAGTIVNHLCRWLLRFAFCCFRIVPLTSPFSLQAEALRMAGRIVLNSSSAHFQFLDHTSAFHTTTFKFRSIYRALFWKSNSTVGLLWVGGRASLSQKLAGFFGNFFACFVFVNVTILWGNGFSI